MGLSRNFTHAFRKRCACLSGGSTGEGPSMTSAELSCAAVRAMASRILEEGTTSQKEMNESITDVTTTTFVVLLAGFIGPPFISHIEKLAPTVQDNLTQRP